jgi:hypothetical protein
MLLAYNVSGSLLLDVDGLCFGLYTPLEERCSVWFQ